MGSRGSNKELRARRRLTLEAIYEQKLEEPRVNLSNLLRFAKVSKSTYYYYVRTRMKKTTRDIKALQMIRYLHKKRNGKLGIRQMKLEVYREFGVTINHKKIARLKRENGLQTKIRKKRSYAQINATPHKTFPNILDREFRAEKPKEKMLTDITQINYGSHQKAYLVAFKDLADKSIVSYKLSSSLEYPFVGIALKEVLELKGNNQMLIHSDQGIHFSCRAFTKALSKNGVVQSMSRKGECHDNAPMESFFGLIKDHLDPKKCKNLGELRMQVDNAIKYYNYERPQIGLNKMSPVEYRRHLA